MGLVILIIILAVIAIIVLVIASAVEESVAVGLVVMCVYLLVAIPFGIMQGVGAYADEHWATCHVTGKDRGADNGSYRVYTSDCGVLANSDAWLRGKFNSADIWQQIPSDSVITVHLVGVRNGFFSWFPNILEVKATK